MVDVAIGLVLMYLLLSLVCTTINEIITTFLKIRAKTLSKTVEQLLDDADIRKAFYNHGLISNAVRASRSGKPQPGATVGGNTRGQETNEAGKPKDKEHPSYFDPRTVALALLDSLNKGDQENPGQQQAFPGIASIRQSVAALPDSNIRDVLLASLSDAGNDIDRARNNIATWFDAAMDRLSGGYKRKLKVLSLVTGFVIACSLNADSVAVGKRLWADQALRGELVVSASSTVGAGLPKDCENDRPAEQLNCLTKRLNDLDAGLRPFPIGWGGESWPDVTISSWLVAGWLFMKVLGLAWTGLALSLGAPFWFDVLQKFVNLRGTGVKPEEKKSSGNNSASSAGPGSAAATQPAPPASPAGGAAPTAHAPTTAGVPEPAPA